MKISSMTKIFRKLDGNLKLVCNSEESIDCYAHLTSIFYSCSSEKNDDKDDKDIRDHSSS